MPIVLTDGDPIVYRCGFAAQHRVIHAVCEDANGEPYNVRFESKTGQTEWLEAHPGHEVLLTDVEIEVEPLPFCLQTVKAQLQPIELLGDLQIFLTGTGNHREKIATIKQYKIDRKDTPRPERYQDIRDYLTTNKRALIIDGREADDEISIRAHALRKRGMPYIVATIDKDLDQVPGRHYDYMRGVEYEVTPEQAQKWFWQQVLSGDPTDSIPGCWKVGAETARKLVDEWYLEGYTQDEIWMAVVTQYLVSQGKKGCAYAHMPPEDVALETARLVYMQQHEGELWNPPGVKFGRVEGGKDD